MFPLAPPGENGGADGQQADGLEESNAWRAEPSSPTHSTAASGPGAWSSPFTTPPPAGRRSREQMHRNRPPHLTPSSGFLESPQPASSPVLPPSTGPTPHRRTTSHTHEGSHPSANSSSRVGEEEPNPTVSQFTPSSEGLFHAPTDNQLDSRQAALMGASTGTLYETHMPQQAADKLAADQRHVSEPNQAKSPSRLRRSQTPGSGASTPPRRSLLGSVELPGLRRSRHARHSSTGGSPPGSGKLRSASKLFPGPVVRLGDELVTIELRDSRRKSGSNEEIGECKICLSTQEQAKIIAPCKCKGSARFVHYGCLRQWILERRSLRCELCNTDYAQPFYNSFKEELEANPPRPQFGTQSPFDAETGQQHQNARPAIVFSPGDPNYQSDGIRPDPAYWPQFLPPPDQVPLTGERASEAAIWLIVGFCVVLFIIIVAIGAGVGGGVGGSQ